MTVECLSDFNLDFLLKKSPEDIDLRNEMKRRIVLSGRDEQSHKEAMDVVRQKGEFKEGIWIRCMDGDKIVGMFESISSKYVNYEIYS